VLNHPDEVQGWRDEKTGMRHWRVCGKELSEAEAADMWHRRMYPSPGRLIGLSPVAYHASTIGLGLAAERFGVQWFQDGAHPSGLLTNEAALDPGDAQTAKERFMAAMTGTREPLVLGQGWKYQQVQVSANESQFLETQKYTSAECARIYGPGMPEMLGYETGTPQTYSNDEQRSIHLLTYTLDPLLVRGEEMWTSLLPDGQYAKYNRAALLRTDLLTRYRAHALALRNQFKTVDEVRDDEELQPVPWGAAPLAPLAPDPDETDK
jgi:HK97 family phage portal protein